MCVHTRIEQIMIGQTAAEIIIVLLRSQGCYC